MIENSENLCKFKCGKCQAVWFHPDDVPCPKCVPKAPKGVNVACQTETCLEFQMAIKQAALKEEAEKLKAYYSEVLKKY